MEIKDKLDKPYTEKQKCDFIVKNNHWLGYEIQETNNALLAIYNEPLPPTDEEIRQRRANAYALEVDNLTAHIQRLRDEEQTPEIEAEIQALIEERALKVEEIKQRYPYPEGEDESDSID